MQKTIGMMLLFIGISSLAMATPVPEIDPGTGASAIALLSGALLMMRRSRKK